MDVDADDAKELLSALGKVLEVREIEEIRTPDGELDYDTIQRVRHVLLLVRVRLSRTRGGPTNKPIVLAPGAHSFECVEKRSEKSLRHLRSSLTDGRTCP